MCRPWQISWICVPFETMLQFIQRTGSREWYQQQGDSQQLRGWVETSEPRLSSPALILIWTIGSTWALMHHLYVAHLCAKHTRVPSPSHTSQLINSLEIWSLSGAAVPMITVWPFLLCVLYSLIEKMFLTYSFKKRSPLNQEHWILWSYKIKAINAKNCKTF